MSLKQTLTQARNHHKLTQAFVAEQIGMQRATYAKHENDSGFTDQQLHRLAKLLKLKYSDLVTAKLKRLRHKHSADAINEAFLRTIMANVAVLVAAVQQKDVKDVHLNMKKGVVSILELELDDIFPPIA